MAQSKSEILQGTLDLMVLKTLDAMGPLHGYGIARRIEQLSQEALRVNQGTIYLCLIRAAGFRLPRSLAGSTEQAGAVGVSGNYFQALGAGAALGRTFL